MGATESGFPPNFHGLNSSVEDRLLDERLTNVTYYEMMTVMKAAGHPSRMTLMYELGSGPRSIGELARLTGLTSATVSVHVRTLEETGLVHRRRDGRKTIVQRAYWRWRRVLEAFSRTPA